MDNFSNVFERKTDCPVVEQFIWDRVACDYGDFSGVEELSAAQLIILRGLCDHQLIMLQIAEKEV